MKDEKEYLRNKAVDLLVKMDAESLKGEEAEKCINEFNTINSILEFIDDNYKEDTDEDECKHCGETRSEHSNESMMCISVKLFNQFEKKITMATESKKEPLIDMMVKKFNDYIKK